MKENESILFLWDKKERLDFFNDLIKDFVWTKKIPINRIFYVYSEAEYKNGFSDFETKLKKSCSQFSMEFESYKIPESTLSQKNGTNIQNVFEELLIPELVKKNPSHLYLVLPDGGSLSVNYAIVGLISINAFENAFGKNVSLYKIHDKESLSESGEWDNFIRASSTKSTIDPNGENEGHATGNAVWYAEIEKNCRVKVPMLILGERGIGKSTAVKDKIALALKKYKFITDENNIQTVVCGSLTDFSLADDELFGHEKGAFTGADEERQGKIELANGGILFLDEIQDLNKLAQRKLLEVLRTHKFNRLGDKESTPKKSDFFLICASNKTLAEVQERLEPDFFDRIAVFCTELISLRKYDEIYGEGTKEERLKELWKNLWDAFCKKKWEIPEEPDSFDLVKNTLMNSELWGNIRDIEQLLAYIARDVYEGNSKKFDGASQNAKKEKYDEAIQTWQIDYKRKYNGKKSKSQENSELISLNQDMLKKRFQDNYSKETKDNLCTSLSEELKLKLEDTAKAMFPEAKTDTELVKYLGCAKLPSKIKS